jgi:hypothetical protein
MNGNLAAGTEQDSQLSGLLHDRTDMLSGGAVVA